MPYFPKSQIKTNLFTNGNEFVLEGTMDFYIGYYWFTADGRYFTGRSPEANPNPRTLEKPRFNPEQEQFQDPRFNEDNIEYTRLNNPTDLIPKSPPMPYTFRVDLTQDNVPAEITRYFCYKNVDKKQIIEIDEDTYRKLRDNDKTILFSQYTPFRFLFSLRDEAGNRGRVADADTQNSLRTYFIQWFNFYHSYTLL